MVDSTPQYPSSRDPLIPRNDAAPQVDADRVRGQDDYDAALSVGSTINEGLGMPLDLSGELTAEEAALRVTDDGLYAQEIEAIDHLGQDIDGDLTQAPPPEARSFADSEPLKGAKAKIPQIKERLGDLRGKAQDSFQMRPYTYVLGAVGLGFVLGKVFAGRQDHI